MNPDEQKHTAQEYYYQGVSFTQQSNFSEAEKAFKRALALEPNIAEAYNYLGFVAIQQGRASLAEIASLFRQATKLNPEYGEAYYNLGVILTKQGLLSEAQEAYLQVIKISPGSTEGYYNLGVVFSKLGLLAKAQVCFQEVIKLKPDYVAAYFNLGVTLKDQGLLEAAIATFKECLQLKSDYHQAYNSLGAIYKQQNLLENAAASFQQALIIKNDYIEAYSNLCVVLVDQNKISEAEAVCRQAIALKPDYAPSYNVLGSIFMKRQLFKEAAEAFKQSVALQPDYAEAYNNLAVAFTDLEEHTQAQQAGLEAIRLKPDYAEAYNNLAIVYLGAGNFIEAGKVCRRCLQIKPDYAEAYNNLGLILTEQRLLEPALAAFEQAIKLKPDYHKVKFTHACTHLLAGNLIQGFEEYESRWQAHGLSLPNVGRPLWDGSSLVGKTILLYAEQGLGDTLQFIRYADVLQAQGATVKLACPGELKELLNGVKSLTEVTHLEQLPKDFDVYAPLLSIPHLLGTTIETIPTGIPYIKSIKKAELQKKEGLNIGIVWASGYRHGDLTLYQLYKKKSASVDLFMQLLDIPSVTLYSLQVGKDAAALAPYENHPRVVNLSPQIKDFTDTAAFIEQMDLVISVDTSVAHLAGGMGIPVWLLLYFTPDWRWLLGRGDTPWYPNMRLFRQQTPEDWAAVFREVMELLQLVG